MDSTDSMLNNYTNFHIKFFVCPKCDALDNMYVKEKGKLVMEKKNDVENKKEFWTEFCEILRTNEMRHWFDEFKKRNKISKT